MDQQDADDYRSVSIAIRAGEFYGDGRDPSDFIHEIDGHVRLGDDLSQHQVIGRFNLFQIDGNNALDQGFGPFTVYDTLQVTFDVYQYLFRREDEYSGAVKRALGDPNPPWSLNVLLLNRLEIWPPYRGKGYGLQALVRMIQRFRIGGGLLVMKPFPLQFEGNMGAADDAAAEERAFRAARGKLCRYYRRLGFESVRETPYMVRQSEGRVRVASKATRSNGA